MKWISVKDFLPSEDEWILLSNENYVSMGIRIKDKFYDPDLDYFELKNITHWMPLPVPPNTSQNSHPDQDLRELEN